MNLKKTTTMLIKSITKIMTCIIALEHAIINDIVNVDESILKNYGIVIYIPVGRRNKFVRLVAWINATKWK